MKNPKKLMRRHKIFLSSKGLNWKNYLIERENDYSYVFYNKDSKKLETMWR